MCHVRVSSSCSLTMAFAESIGFPLGHEGCLKAASMVELSPPSVQTGAGSNRRRIDDASRSAISLHIELREGAGLHAAVRRDGRETHTADGGKAARCALAARRARRRGPDAERIHQRGAAENGVLDGPGQAL